MDSDLVLRLAFPVEGLTAIQFTHAALLCYSCLAQSCYVYIVASRFSRDEVRCSFWSGSINLVRESADIPCSEKELSFLFISFRPLKWVELPAAVCWPVLEGVGDVKAAFSWTLSYKE